MSWPIGYATVNGDLFKLPARGLSRLLLAVSMTPPKVGRALATPLNTTFSKHWLGGWRKRRSEPGCLVNLPGSPGGPSPVQTWNFPGFYSFEVDFAGARGVVQAKTPSASFYLLKNFHFSRRRTASITRRSQKFQSVGSRLTPKWIGALTLRGSYTEAFHAPRPIGEFHPLSSSAGFLWFFLTGC